MTKAYALGIEERGRTSRSKIHFVYMQQRNYILIKFLFNHQKLCSPSSLHTLFLHIYLVLRTTRLARASSGGCGKKEMENSQKQLKIISQSSDSSTNSETQ